MIKSIEKDHNCKRRNGTSLAVRLSAYKKDGTYVVSKGPNLKSAEVPCKTLEEVSGYANQGYMVRMQSEIMDIDGKRRRINGLYSHVDLKVIK